MIAVMRGLRRRLFASPGDALITLAMLGLIAAVAPPLLRWLLLDAQWSGPAAACRAASGACWAFVGEKYRLILFGRYPAAEQWRPLLAMLLLVGMLAVSCDRRTWRRSLLLVWAATAASVWLLMHGGVAGLAEVDDTQWGGLPLTLILAVTGIAAAFPPAVLLALARRSALALPHALAVAFIELVRGVPLISMLFLASFMVPLFLPRGVQMDELLRALVAITLFSAAYLAEAIRGGLQAVPRGQADAADALGLRPWQRLALVVLPQALRTVIPPMVNIFIGLFKDTSLVAIVGLMDLLLAAKQALADPAWRSYALEAYLFIGAIYFAFCFAMSRYSRYLERHLHQGGPA